MSGGRFNYLDCSLKSEIFGWADAPHNAFEDREVSELVWDVLELIHAYDWYASGDTCEETYLKEKTAFKKKWLGGNRGLRVKQTIDKVIEEARQELYKTYGFKLMPPDYAPEDEK